jgi:glutathione S-transferase
MAPTFQLIGVEHSYFSGKVRAYLRWKQVPFTEIVPTQEVYRQVILPRVGWSVIPVLVVTDGSRRRYIQDTSDIIDEVERLFPENRVVPEEPRLAATCFLIELLADQWLVVPAMYYRWCFPEQRPFLEREWGAMLAPTRPVPERLAVAREAMKKFARMAEGIGATTATGPAIERSFERLLELLSAHLLSHEFLLGSRATLADFAFMGPFYAHLLHDPVPGHVMRMRAPLVSAWVERVMGFPTACPATVTPDGELLPTSPPTEELLLTDTLVAVVQHMLDEYAPIFSQTVQKMKGANFEDDALVPRALGFTDFELGGIAAKRSVSTMDLWKAQRFYDCLDSSTRAWVGATFGVSGSQMLSHCSSLGKDGEARVKRVENVLRRGWRDSSTYSEYVGKPSKL